MACSFNRCSYFLAMCRYSTAFKAIREAYSANNMRLVERWLSLSMAPDQIISEYELEKSVLHGGMYEV